MLKSSRTRTVLIDVDTEVNDITREQKSFRVFVKSFAVLLVDLEPSNVLNVRRGLGAQRITSRHHMSNIDLQKLSSYFVVGTFEKKIR